MPEQLTEFEEQVLQAMASSIQHFSFLEQYVGAGFIRDEGRNIFHFSWGGPERQTQTGFEAFPTIDGALGRLRRKGYVVSSPSAAGSSERKIWRFTPLAQAVHRVPPEAAL